MVTEILWPDNAPWWLNLLIWVAFSWQYILAGFVPAFYLAVVKLFGFPLLQRWKQEVVIMLYPNRVRFGKITEKMESYFYFRKGAYWTTTPLKPYEYIETPETIGIDLDKLRKEYEVLAVKPDKTKQDKVTMKNLLKKQKLLHKKVIEVKPENTIHIFNHPINQPIYHNDRMQSKVDHVINENVKVKPIKGHGVWLMKNIKLHFHRHWQLIVSPDNTEYQLIPVKDRQEYSIGFWHSLGISTSKIVEKEAPEEEMVGSSTGGGGKRQALVLTPFTTYTVLEAIQQAKQHANFSAGRAYNILKKRGQLDTNFLFWLTGTTNPMVWIILIGMIAVVAVIFLMFHQSAPAATPGTPAPTSGRWLG